MEPHDHGSSDDLAIRIQGLSKAFRGHLGIGRTPAVNGLNLEVRRGEIFGLLGPNGAGKTTTLKLLLGLMRPDQGQISLLGHPPSDPRARAQIGFLPENPYFYAYLTAEEFLDFYGRLQGLRGDERRERIAATLQRVGLADRAGTALRKFSKGMTQRLGLAQAIQHDPELIILDEPMSGLDPSGRAEVRDLILSLRRAGRTVFFSSHILQDAEMLCDRVAILERGRVLAAGPLDQLVSRRVRWFDVTVGGVAADRLPAEVLSADGTDLLVRVPDTAALEELFGAIRAAGGRVSAVEPRRETLEDLFLKTIGRAPSGGVN